LKQDKYDPSEAIKQTLVPSKKSWAYLITIGSRVTGSLKEPTKGDILYCSCQEGNPKYFIFCKNSKLQDRSNLGNTPTLEFFCKFAFSSTNLSPITNSESQRYHYPVCHTLVATQHPLSRFQSPARGPVLSLTRSLSSLHVGARALLVENEKNFLFHVQISRIKRLLSLH
jgi:hypothetical protein